MLMRAVWMLWHESWPQLYYRNTHYNKQARNFRPNSLAALLLRWITQYPRQSYLCTRLACYQALRLMMSILYTFSNQSLSWNSLRLYCNHPEYFEDSKDSHILPTWASELDREQSTKRWRERPLNLVDYQHRHCPISSSLNSVFKHVFLNLLGAVTTPKR